MRLDRKEQRKAERQEKTNDQCCKGHRFIFRNLFLETHYLWNYLLKRIGTVL